MIIHLIGTKAQYIKMAPVVLECMRRGLPCSIIYTGQHSETFADLQANFGLPGPDRKLYGAGEATDRQSFIKWLREAWKNATSPAFADIWRQAAAMVVHGDTASTLLGARVARRFGIPLVHVEAGLRSFNYLHPFPEEIIRVMVSKQASVHCCPDEVAAGNLRRAKVKGEIFTTSGNTMLDALRIASSGNSTAASFPRYGIFSLHRHENIFDKKRFVRALDLARQVAHVLPLKFVLHPVTLRRLQVTGHYDAMASAEGVQLVSRMDFFSFHRLLAGATVVATDGGSNQEECALLNIPCAVLRRFTERPDGLGDNVLLADLEESLILPFVGKAISDPPEPRALPDSSPSAIIVDRLQSMSASARVG